jgi:hypothetical protein
MQEAILQDAALLTTTDTAAAESTITRSRTPSIFVPRRTRINGLENVPAGAAIVGTPQGDGTVAVDVAATHYVDPTPAIWGRWVAEAARQHVAADDDLIVRPETHTLRVSEDELVEVGRYDTGQVLVANNAVGGELSAWIEAGRAAFAAEGSSQSWDSLS